MGNVITGDDPTGYGGALAIECLYCNDTTVFWKTFRLCTIQPAMGLRLCSDTAGEPQTLLL